MKDLLKMDKVDQGKVDQFIARKLNFARSLAKMTQSELAAAVGISTQQVLEYENGLDRISAGRLYNLAKALEVEVDYFFEGLE